MIAPILALVLAQSPAEPAHFGGFLAEIPGLEEPAAVAVGPNDEIYVVERFAHRVRVFDAGGRELRRFGEPLEEPLETAIRLVEPEGIAVAADGTVFVSNTGHDRIARFAADGASLGPYQASDWDPGWLRTPLGLDWDEGRLLITNSRHRELALYSPLAESPWKRGQVAAWRRILGSEAGLLRPVDVAFGTNGAVFVADAVRHQVIELDAQGEVRRAIGDFGPYSGQFASPSGLDHSNGRLYVADRDNHRIQVFDAVSAKLLYDWGIHSLRPHEGQGRLHYPNDVAIAPSGKFAVVCEGFENRVQVFGPETDESTTLAQSQERNTASHFGFGVSVAGRVGAIVEPSAPSVLVYDLTQDEPIEIARFGLFGRRVGTFLTTSDVEVDRGSEQIFVADAERRSVELWSVARAPDEPLRYDPLLPRLVQSYDFEAELEEKVRRWSRHVVEPIALELDRRGRLWVVDGAGQGVVSLELVSEGDRTKGFGPQTSPPIGVGFLGLKPMTFDYTHGKQIAEPVLRIPTDVALDRAGERLYVVDAGEQRVEAYRISDIGGEREIEPAFTFGGYGTGPGEFVRPTGIAAGLDGFVYVTDEGGHRILKFDEQGKFVAQWGRRGLGRVEFYKPRGITQHPDGRLYVVDYGNHRGQVLTSDGEFVVAFGARLFIQPTFGAK